jgi:CO/xanthine dehydrogenase FAD-binding subunit
MCATWARSAVRWANNDPAGDYPAAALALGAMIVTDVRRIPAQDFFKGLFETGLENGELTRKSVSRSRRRWAT